MLIIESIWRQEQAAEEGGPGDQGMAGFIGWRVGLSPL